MNSQGLSLIEADNLECVLNANVYEVVEETHREAFINFNEKICRKDMQPNLVNIKANVEN